MPIDIQLSLPSSGPDRTAIWTLAATIGLFVAALAQVIVAGMQARAANRQSRAAELQATAADKQASAAERQVKAAERALQVSIDQIRSAKESADEQIRSAKESADNATMPLLEVVAMSYWQTINYRVVVQNNGPGPAQKIMLGEEKDGQGLIDEEKLIRLDRTLLHSGEDFTVQVAKSQLSKALILHYESSQNSSIDARFTVGGVAPNETVSLTPVRCVRPYGEAPGSTAI